MNPTMTPAMYPPPNEHGRGAMAALMPLVMMVLKGIDAALKQNPASDLVNPKDGLALIALIEAEQAWRALLADPSSREKAAAVVPLVPLLTAVSMALAGMAGRLFAAAGADALYRDVAAREIIDARAWVTPDGTVIEAPVHEA